MNKFEKTLRFIQQSITPESPFYEQIFLVGGCVRDELLGERYSDLDLLINFPDGQKQFVEYMCATYPQTCKGPFYYQRYGTTAMDIFIDGSMTLVECVEPHIEEYADDGQTLLQTRFCSLEEDSSRRDYTCNALYKNLHTSKVLDPTGTGIEDLKAGLLRTPSDPYQIYRQDPVRMLRGIRFKHQKGFRLDPICWDAICELHDEMRLSAPKRLRDELNKMLKARSFANGIDDLYKTGLLAYVMPGMEEVLANEELLPETIDTDGNGMTLWQHTMLALNTLTHEHPHCETISKLTILVTDVALMYGKNVAAQLLANAGIGKEKIGSILHTIELYIRFSRMFEAGVYQARPRDLPHLITALAGNRDEFRRLVRALNQGLCREYQRPWRVFYDNANLPKRGQSVSTESTPAPFPLSDRNHRRGRGNGRRRYQANTQDNPANGSGNPANAGEINAGAQKPQNKSANHDTPLTPEELERQKERNRKRNLKRRDQRKRQRERRRMGGEENLSAAITEDNNIATPADSNPPTE